ncbi:MAG: SET domain-containing protein [Patescibacteria group bacterium]|jgi:hypothetical protein
MFILPNSYFKIKTAKNKGRGVFTLKEIEPGAVIGDYLGRVVSDEESDIFEDKHGFYAMDFTNGLCIIPDLSSPGVHLINNSCSPNCDAIPYKEHVIYYALRRIFRGEELTISYFLDPLDKEDEQVYPCYCGSPLCHGTMYVSKERAEKRDSFLDKFHSNRNEMKIGQGEDLLPLKKYPKQVRDYMEFDIFGCWRKKPYLCSDKVLPGKKELRKRIRESGRCLDFKNLNIRIYGIMNGLIISY